MLRQFPSSHAIGKRMVIYPSSMKHAPSVVIVLWQRSEHGNISFIYETSSVCCKCLLTTVRAWWYIPRVWSMLRQLPSSHDNSQGMVIYLLGMNHASSFVIVSRQRSEHGNIYIKYETCSVSCHRLITTVRVGNLSLWQESCSVSCQHLMTTVRAWWCKHQVWNMLRQLSLSNNNGQSMVIYHSCTNMLRGLSSSNDNGQSMVIYP